MLPILLSIIVTVFSYFVIPNITDFCGLKKETSRNFLILACICYWISWYLPQPLIEGQNTQFMTHVVGGGIFTGFIWIYLRSRIEHMNPLLEALSLYALVSMLGVSNELFELLVSKAHLVFIDPSDTWWDLFANTLGATIVWFAFRLNKAFKSV
jgi:hypothetical protein